MFAVLYKRLEHVSSDSALHVIHRDGLFQAIHDSGGILEQRPLCQQALSCEAPAWTPVEWVFLHK